MRVEFLFWLRSRCLFSLSHPLPWRAPAARRFWSIATSRWGGAPTVRRCPVALLGAVARPTAWWGGSPLSLFLVPVLRMSMSDCPPRGPPFAPRAPSLLPPCGGRPCPCSRCRCGWPLVCSAVWLVSPPPRTARVSGAVALPAFAVARLTFWHTPRPARSSLRASPPAYFPAAAPRASLRALSFSAFCLR